MCYATIAVASAALSTLATSLGLHQKFFSAKKAMGFKPE
jgi:hypothetical protein